jgi:pimeloyl-ACP methyl ester carboxylesterase
MKRASVNGVELEYRVVGAGEPVLFISPVFPDAFFPLLTQRALADGYQLIVYHKRGWVGSTRTAPGSVSVADHARDAAALLDHLSIRRAHIAGHGSGSVAALQLAFDFPERVHSLVLFETALLTMPAAKPLLERAAPALEAFGAGDHETALATFMTAVTGLPWERCRALMEERVPGLVAQALADAETFFATELPPLTSWVLDRARAATFSQPVLSVLGVETQPFFHAVDEVLRASFPHVETRKIAGVGHLLHLQRPEPVAREVAEFLRRHPIVADPAHDPGEIAKARAQFDALNRMYRDTAAERASRQREKPLYERLGGRDAIHAVTKDIIELHFTEAVTKPLTRGVDKEKLIALVTEWLCQAAGGAEKYTGRDMVTAHAHLGMTDVHFMAAGDQILRCLKKHGVPEPEIQEVLCAIIAHHDDVVGTRSA